MCHQNIHILFIVYFFYRLFQSPQYANKFLFFAELTFFPLPHAQGIKPTAICCALTFVFSLKNGFSENEKLFLTFRSNLQT